MGAGHFFFRVLLTSVNCLVALQGVLAGDWVVKVPGGAVYVPQGSSVLLPCSYDFPAESALGVRHNVLSEMWCLRQSHCITPQYVYHSAGIFTEPAYQGRVQYLGQIGSRNCSLRISDLRVSDSGVYVFRFITDHPVAKLPGQAGLRLIVTDGPNNTSVVIHHGGAEEGNRFTLTCSSNANPPIKNYTWFKTQGNVKTYTGSGQNHTIQTVSTEGDVQYMCIAQNGFGTQTAIIEIPNHHGKGHHPIAGVVVSVVIAVLLIAMISYCIWRGVVSKSHKPVETTEPNL